MTSARAEREEADLKLLSLTASLDRLSQEKARNDAGTSSMQVTPSKWNKPSN